MRVHDLVQIYKNRYVLQCFQICPFEHIKEGSSTLLHPLRNEGYSYVPCLLDKKNNTVVELDSELEYEYIEMVSGYMLNKQEVVEGRRYAIVPYYLSDSDLTDEQLNKIDRIVYKLEYNLPFTNGNEVLSNEEYLERIKEKEQSKTKVKRG